MQGCMTRIALFRTTRRVGLYRRGRRPVRISVSKRDLNEIAELLRRSPSWRLVWHGVNNRCAESWERIPERGGDYVKR